MHRYKYCVTLQLNSTTGPDSPVHLPQVTVLERMRHAGKKIIVSGGQRCNVLPEELDLQTDFISECKPGALRALFASWSLDDCRHWCAC